MGFCDRVLECLSRATDKEKEAVRQELEAHMEDHRDALVEAGMDPASAMEKAEAAMGDPEEVGRVLNAQFSTFWLWVKRVTQGIIGFILFLALAFSLPQVSTFLTNPVDVLAGAWENWQIRQAKEVEPDTGYESGGVIYSWKGWETMRVGDEIICLVQVDLRPFYRDRNYYEGHFYFCTYNENPFTPPNTELLALLTVTPASGTMIDPESNWGWSLTPADQQGAAIRHYMGLMREGETYVDVTYDHYGIYVTMRCPLIWEEGEP